MSRKPSRVCFVGCLSIKITEEDLYEYFKTKIGGVEEINLKRDSNGNSRRFAIVTFENPEYAQRAIDELDDTRFGNTIIHIESYKTKRQQNYERDEEYREERLKRKKENDAPEKSEEESDESGYSDSSSTTSSSSSSSSGKRRKHRHHRHHRSSSSTSDKKSKSGHRHRHHRHHRH